MLLKDTVVCTKGAALSPSEANILKLLGITMAEFHVTLTHAYNEADGVSFLQGGGGGAASALMEDGSPYVAHVLKKKGGYSIRVLRTHATQRADVDRHVGGHFFVTDLIITP